MPRPNQPRSIASEKALARQVAAHREAKKMSYEGLASRMTLAGCAINASGIYKIEKAGRRITVDELVAFSQVFGVAITDLLIDPDIAANQRLAELAGEWEAAYREYWAVDERVAKAWDELQSFVLSGAVDDAGQEALASAFGESFHADADPEVREREAAHFMVKLTDADHWKARRDRFYDEVVKQAGLD